MHSRQARNRLTEHDYRSQAEFRYHLRRFLKTADLNAKAAGLNSSQYQALLILKGMPEGVFLNVTRLAERMLIENHSTVELVDRLIRKGLVERFREGTDRRMVFLRLTAQGSDAVWKVAEKNREALKGLLPSLEQFLHGLQHQTMKAEG